MLLSACLIVAKKMGKVGGVWNEMGRHKSKDLALGGANRCCGSRRDRGLDTGRRLEVIVIGGKQSFGRVLGGGILGRKLGAMRKADEDKTRKAEEKYAGTLSYRSQRISLDGKTRKRFGWQSFFMAEVSLRKPGRDTKKGYSQEKGVLTKKKELYHESWAYLLGDLKHGETYSDEEKI